MTADVKITSDPYTLTEGGVLVPTPTGVEVTWIHLRYGGIVKVHEPYDAVRNDWLSAIDRGLISLQFHDWCYTENQVCVLVDDIVLLSIGWEDLEVIKQDLRERELTKKLRDKSLNQLSLEANRKR